MENVLSIPEIPSPSFPSFVPEFLRAGLICDTPTASEIPQASRRSRLRVNRTPNSGRMSP